MLTLHLCHPHKQPGAVRHVNSCNCLMPVIHLSFEVLGAAFRYKKVNSAYSITNSINTMLRKFTVDMPACSIVGAEYRHCAICTSARHQKALGTGLPPQLSKGASQVHYVSCLLLGSCALCRALVALTLLDIALLTLLLVVLCSPFFFCCHVLGMLLRVAKPRITLCNKRREPVSALACCLSLCAQQ